MSEVQCSVCRVTVPQTETIIVSDDDVHYQILCKLCSIDLKNEAMGRQQQVGTKK